MLKHQKRGGNGASQSLPYPIFISHKIKDGEHKQAALNRPKYTFTAGYGLPNESIVQNHLNIALLNVFWYLNGRYRHIFIP